VQLAAYFGFGRNTESKTMSIPNTWCEGRYPMLPPQSNAPPVNAQPSEPWTIPGGSYWNLQNPAAFGFKFPVNSPSYVNGAGMAGIANPSSQLQSPALTTPEQREVKAGDVFSIEVASPYSPVSIEGLVAHLQASGIADNISVQYQPPTPYGGQLIKGDGKLMITGFARDDWPDAATLCGEILKKVAETGYAMSLNSYLSCVITPTAQPAMSKFEVPGWLILLLLGGALWLWWKSNK
jgi:hypothetical protein